MNDYFGVQSKAFPGVVGILPILLQWVSACVSRQGSANHSTLLTAR